MLLSVQGLTRTALRPDVSAWTVGLAPPDASRFGSCAWATARTTEQERAGGKEGGEVIMRRVGKAGSGNLGFLSRHATAYDQRNAIKAAVATML